MTEPRYCPQCQAAITADVPGNLCPACLMQLALESTTETFDHSIVTKTLPTVSFLADGTIPESERLFGDYVLLQEIGRGGMGVVYKARQLSLNRIVAVKMMLPGRLASQSDVQRFHAEAEAAGNLQHPNIVAVHDVGEHDGLHYFSMDYVEGKSLAELISRHPLRGDRAARTVKTIAEAVHYAHRQGFLHRDLKPSNVLRDKSGQLRVTDFGLAKRLEGDSGLTDPGVAVGTPSYMSPEQVDSKRGALTPASDVYSLGATLYELLTGRPPFQAATALDIVALVLNEEPVAPRSLNSKLNRDLETICLKCLEKDSRQRYQSAQELADDLDRFLKREPIKVRPISLPNRTWRWCRRNPWQTFAAATLVLLAVVLSIWAITSRQMAITSQQRLWQSLLEQVRSERLTGDREKSLKAAAEAARISSTLELRQEAIQTITSPGVHLLHEIEGDKAVFSPDGKMLAVRAHNQRQENEITKDVPMIRVFETQTLRHLADLDCDFDSQYTEFAFNPTAPLLAILKMTTQKDAHPGTEGIWYETVILCSPVTGQIIAEIKLHDHSTKETSTRGPLLFSPDGTRLAVSWGWNSFWQIDVDRFRKEAIKNNGQVVAFLSNDELLISSDEYLKRWNMTTRKLRISSPQGMSKNKWWELVEERLKLQAGKKDSFYSESISSRVKKLSSRFPQLGHMTVIDHHTTSANGRFAAFLQYQPKQLKVSLVIWDTLAEKPIGRYSIAEAYTHWTLLSEDGRLVAAKTTEELNPIRLWKLTTSGLKPVPIPSIPGYDPSAISPDGSLLVALSKEVGTGKVNVLIFDTETGSEVALLRNNDDPVWSSDGHLLATHSSDPKAIKIWEVVRSTREYYLPRKEFQGEEIQIAFSPDSKQLISNVGIWEVVAKFDPRRLLSSSQQLPFLVGGVFGTANQLWAVESQRDQFPNPTTTFKLQQLAPEKHLVILDNPGYADLKLNSGEPLFAEIKGLAVARDGRFLVTACQLWERRSHGWGSNGKTLELWDMVARRRLAILNKETPEFYSWSFSPDGKQVAASDGAQPGTVTIWDAMTGNNLQELCLNHFAKVVIFSPDMKLIFFGGDALWLWPAPPRHRSESSITVKELKTGRELGIWKGRQGSVLSLAISPDGRLLASGGEDGIICLWEVPTGRELARLESHKSGVTALAFSPDGCLLASGSNDRTLKLWDIPFIRNELKNLRLDW